MTTDRIPVNWFPFHVTVNTLHVFKDKGLLRMLRIEDRDSQYISLTCAKKNLNRQKQEMAAGQLESRKKGISLFYYF